MYSNDDSHLFSGFENIFTIFGNGDLWQGVLFVILATFLFFNIPTAITLVRGKGVIKAVDEFGRAIMNMGLAMTPFTFPLGYMGLWHSFKESIS